MTEIDRRTTITLSKDIRDKLNLLKKELGFRSITALFNYTVLEMTREGLIPPAEYSVIFDKLGTRPCIITGESGSGKTTAVRGLLKAWTGPAFILDVTNEYPEFKRVDLGAVFGMKWESPRHNRIRFVSNPNVEASRGEASAIFGHLNYLKSTGALKEWVIVIEEGHRFGGDANLRSLLIEGRKSCRKVMLITTDWSDFRGIARTFKPRPWELEGLKVEVSTPEATSDSKPSES